MIDLLHVRNDCLIKKSTDLEPYNAIEVYIGAWTWL